MFIHALEILQYTALPILYSLYFARTISVRSTHARLMLDQQFRALVCQAQMPRCSFLLHSPRVPISSPVPEADLSRVGVGADPTHINCGLWYESSRHRLCPGRTHTSVRASERQRSPTRKASLATSQRHQVISTNVAVLPGEEKRRKR